jgi:hypothetical protein
VAREKNLTAKTRRNGADQTLRVFGRQRSCRTLRVLLCEARRNLARQALGHGAAVPLRGIEKTDSIRFWRYRLYFWWGFSFMIHLYELLAQEEVLVIQKV